MSLDKLFTELKGGSGSGNFGHSGIPGKHGGSSPKGFSGNISKKPILKKRPFGDPEIGRHGKDIRDAWNKIISEEKKELIRDLVEKYYDGSRTLRQAWLLALGLKK